MAAERHELECEEHGMLLVYTTDTNTRRNELVSFWVKKPDENCERCQRISKLYVAFKIGY